ncbi:MAG: toprim domain-containing protein [Candidatus Marinimicrobia bacterium]|nr:toprim domain-containing protein [Candidatus Neomarinimicrobiota bacterium]
MKYDIKKIRAIPILDIANRLGLEFNGKNKTRCMRPERHRNGDADSSLSYDSKRNVLHCFACGLDLDGVELVKQVQGNNFREACQFICDNFNITIFPQSKLKPQPKSTTISLQDKKRAVNFHKALVTNFDDLKSRGKIPRCWTLKVVKDLQVGFDLSEDCITYLHFNEKCEPVNIRWHKKKSITGHGGTIFYPVQALYSTYSKNRLLILAEGEKDVVTLQSMGFQAITCTNGAYSIPKDISPLSGFKIIIIIYDHDKAGEDGALKFAQRLSEDFQK